jgi:pimeloyl-ACP methyl ester carboxylesterase
MALSTFASGRLWGAKSGKGTPWALGLHGWRRDHHDFDPVLSDLDAVCLDLPGFGVAPEPPEPWSSTDYAKWVGPVLEEMAAGPVVVVGHSFGARVAVRLAEAFPERVGTLVLTGAPLAAEPGRPAHRVAPGYRLLRWLHRVGVVPEASLEAARQRYGSADYRGASPLMRGVLVRAVEETARGAYLAPLRHWAGAGGCLELVWGEGDTVAPLGAARAGLAGPPEVPARWTVVAGAGHLLSADLAAAVRSAVLRHAPCPASS